MFDYHSHSQYSGDIAHGKGSSIKELCAAACERGITELAVTDHCDIDGIIDGYFVPLDHESVYDDIMEAKEEFKGRLKLLFGIELGQGIHKPLESDELLKKYPYDIVLGSVHAVRGITDFSDSRIDLLTESERKDLWDRYLSELMETVEWGHFDVLTHITYPKRYYLKCGIKNFPDIANKGREYFEPILKAVIEKGITLECNTSGLRQIMGECLPNRDLLEFYYDLGGRDISLGSDAHNAIHIGAGIAEATEMLKSIGFKYAASFDQRKKSFKPL